MLFRSRCDRQDSGSGHWSELLFDVKNPKKTALHFDAKRFRLGHTHVGQPVSLVLAQLKPVAGSGDRVIGTFRARCEGKVLKGNQTQGSNGFTLPAMVAKTTDSLVEQRLEGTHIRRNDLFGGQEI